jgi:ABC-type glycerol-3-phosphate transport system permease component
MRRTKEDIVFDSVNYFFLGIVSLIILYPLYFVFIASFSNPDAVNSGKVILFPKGFTFGGYKQLFGDNGIWLGYKNTIFYTTAGVCLDVLVTISAAFSLSRPKLVGRKFLIGYFVFTMYFNGGLIPLYLTINKLHLYNNPAVLVILGSVSVYNMIITITYFKNSLPEELFDAAAIDGCGNFRFFYSIVIPLSKSIIAVLVVFYGVAHWNSFFNAMMYIADRKYYPLQLILREILLQNRMVEPAMTESAMIDLIERQRYAEMIKYGVIIVASLPVLIIYPFAQKHFVKGVMIGSVKG